VDASARRYSSARTWGQFVTGEFQDSIGKAIETSGDLSFDAD
jgi:hypothetical protein